MQEYTVLVQDPFTIDRNAIDRHGHFRKLCRYCTGGINIPSNKCIVILLRRLIVIRAADSKVRHRQFIVNAGYSFQCSRNRKVLSFSAGTDKFADHIAERVFISRIAEFYASCCSSDSIYAVYSPNIAVFNRYVRFQPVRPPINGCMTYRIDKVVARIGGPCIVSSDTLRKFDSVSIFCKSLESPESHCVS